MSIFFPEERFKAEIDSLKKEIWDLKNEVARLKDACTMRVGRETRSVFLDEGGYAASDPRPVLTAIRGVQTLLEIAGYEIQVENKPIKFVPVKRREE